MNNTIIRQASFRDISVIADIERICFNQYEAATYAELKARFQTFGEWFLVAECQDQVIGFINGCSTNAQTIDDKFYHDMHFHHPEVIYQCVFGLDILPEYRHLGNARLLMNSYIDLARDNNKKGLILTCKDKLIPFYQSFGFACLGRSLSTHGGAQWNDMILYL